MTIVPILSTLAGSATALLPIVATEPIVPPFGLMMLLAWRLLRPEIWPVWVALPLGLADDLISGHYLGTAMILWTIAFLSLEWVDQALRWRDSWIEWGSPRWASSRSASAHGRCRSRAAATPRC
ncbi:rod shape-determining protein MreD [Rhizorhabdus histidinilytica]